MTATIDHRLATALPEPVTVTAKEYESLPPNPRVELVDGVVQVMTPATRRHQIIVKKLSTALDTVCPDHLRVAWEQEIHLGSLHRRNPDVMVVDAESDDLDRYSYHPADVLLAIEVVSPGTQTIDRLHKPAEYAAAHIEHYWRIEITPKLAVHTYRLGEAGRYLESGLFTEGDTVAAPGLPWAAVEVDTLAP